jgi:hypothetical protein
MSFHILAVARIIMLILFQITMSESATWSRKEKILAADGAMTDLFGRSVAIYGDNALVGSSRDDDIATDAGLYKFYFYIMCLYSYTTFFIHVVLGSVYSYVLDASKSWSRLGKIYGKDSLASDYFGSSVTIYETDALIGAYGADVNAADGGKMMLFISFT